MIEVCKNETGKREDLKVILYMDDYTELVKKAALYDELRIGRMIFNNEPRIVGGVKQ